MDLSYIPYFQLWSARDYKPIKSLVGHESKVTSLDISGGKILADAFLYSCCVNSICSEFFSRSNQFNLVK
jgi:hypothetical protein